ncbi:FG-GAP-like repeat-containing protein [Streptomyces lincolnensis]|uniref:FG-GAP-like repeat-containing protein n=1 Tax=Streptomyces lincolnensis TaxID=1915 RepID=UPI0037D5C375
MRQQGKLVPVDASLAVDATGRVAPKATGTRLSFSNGGDGRLATMAEDGREIVLSWPEPLPRPRLDGDTATYPEVLPGVDLTVSAAGESFSHALVVKNAEAAKNPDLAAIDFGLTGNGVGLTAEPDGELRALDPTGTPVFSAPKPRMWDSAEAPALSGKAFRKNDALGVRPLNDVLDGAADGSHQAELGVGLSGRKLTLKPDLEMFADPTTVYPVVIDPVWAKDAWKNAWSIAYKHTAYPGSENTVYWNGGTLSDDARVGHANDTQRGGTIRANTYFRIPTSKVWDKQILESTLRIKQTYAGSWSCKSGDIRVHTVGKSLPTNISWNNQPSWGELVDSSGESFGGRNCPADSAGLVEFDVTSAVSKASKGHWGNWAFVLSSRTNTIDVSYRKFDPASARVSTRYNTKPSVPTGRSTSPSVPCTGGTFGTTDHVTLRAKVNDAEDNSLTAEFQYKKQDAAKWTSLKEKATRGSVAGVRIDGKALATGTYEWRVRAHDSTPSSSAWAGTCTFAYDKTRPSKLPGVTSKEFPEEKPGGPARTDGTFVFTSGGVTDVTDYEWWTDSDSKVRTVKATKPGGPSANVPYKPLNAGPQYLYLRSLDAASNRSDLRAYLFYPVGKAERDKPRDLNGDGTTDLWSVDPGDGALWVHPGQGSGKFGVGQQAYDDSFGEAVTSHWGSWNDEDGYEDLIALQPGVEDPARKELWVYENRGDGELSGDDRGRYELTAIDDTLNHWRNADQILAIGSMNDDTEDSSGPEITDADAPDLLVKSGAELWLYLGTRDVNRVIDNVPPISLGNADWQDMTLMAPGDLNKDGLPELWARNTKTGKVHQYTSRRNPVASDTTVADLTVYGDPGARDMSIGTGFTRTAYPHLSTSGDFEGDGFADLWARDGEGNSVEFPGQALTGGSAFGAARPLVTAGTPWAECEAFTSQATGKHTLCGPLLAKFRALGGTAKFGHPDTDVLTPPDKTGRYAHFRAPGTTAVNRSIYWSPDTGAWPVSGSIRTKWIALGSESGILGYPASDERATGDGEGRVTHFRKAGRPSAVYWHTDIGAFEIHGHIYAKYKELGGPAYMGYPMTDEKKTSPKAGAYQRFRFPGQQDYTSSMVSSSTTGAWPVRGGIQDRWNALDAENGWLGFPTSAEYEVAGGKRADFENGYIRWNRTSGVTKEHKPEDRTAHLRTDLSGDVNGDGRTDMITVYNYENASTGIHVSTAIAGGGFNAPDDEPAWTSSRAGYDYARSKWAAGDFNGDGRADVAGFLENADGSVTMWSFLASREGTFEDTKALVLPKGTWAWGKTTLLAGDVNGDKRSDLVAFYDYGNATTGVHKMLAKADGTFDAPVTMWKSEAQGWHYDHGKYAIGDTNGDGREDPIAFYGHNTGAVALWTFPVTADGVITKPFRSWNVGAGTWDFDRAELTSGDYNGDRRADVGVLYGEDKGVTGLRTFLAKADGGFEAPLSSWQSDEGKWYAANSGEPLSGDTGNDGRADVVLVYNYTNGSNRAFTFSSREDGGSDGPRGSWYAEPGTW